MAVTALRSLRAYGDVRQVDQIIVDWPNGQQETFHLSVDQVHHVVQGTGVASN